MPKPKTTPESTNLNSSGNHSILEHKFKKDRNQTYEFLIEDEPFLFNIKNGFIILEYIGSSIIGNNYSGTVWVELSDDILDYNFLYYFNVFDCRYEIPIGDVIDKIVIIKSQISEYKEKNPFNGMENLGATCYINSLIQTIYYIPEFKEYVYKAKGYYNFLLKRLFYKMDEANSEPCEKRKRTVSSLKSFIKNISFIPSVNTQQDVHEFSKILFDKLENEDKNIKNVIEGEIVNIINTKCGCERRCLEPFQDLSMLIKSYDGVEINSLEESFKMFCKPDEITGYKCETHGPTNATKRILITKLPPALFILINRFEMDWDTQTVVKNNNYYEFPETIDLKGFCEEDLKNKNPLYHIFAIIVHKGIADKGHFYCYLKLNGSYYKFNDTEVTKSSKEEAHNWNFGGSYASDSKSEKNFSAYYLVYLKDPTLNPVFYNSTEKIAHFLENNEFTIENLIDSYKTIKYHYLNDEDVVGYNGPGRYNIDDYTFPLISIREGVCLTLDNIAKEFPGYSVYDKNFKLLTDAPVENGALYYVVSRREKGILVFIKIFEPSPWCIFPSAPRVITSSHIVSLDDLEKYVEIENYELWLERSRTIIKLENFSDLEQGDVIIISPMDAKLPKFYSEFLKHEFINVMLNKKVGFPIFPKKNLSLLELQKFIQESVLNSDIFIIEKSPSIQEMNDLNVFYEEGKLSSKNEKLSSFINEKQEIQCISKSSDLIYVGVMTGIDINHISHVHPILVPPNITASSLVNSLKKSNFLCITPFLSENNLQIIESFKNSFKARILPDNYQIKSGGGFLVIAKKITNPLKVTFFSELYNPINYPFFIENPGSVFNLRKNMFFSNKIIRYNGKDYHECDIDETLDLEPSETLMIQK